MKIAATGAAGFVGRELAKQAADAGHVFVPIVRRPTGQPGAIVSGDLELADPAMLARGLMGCDAVVHLAARTHVMREQGDALALYHAANVIGTDRLLHAIATSGVKRLVYMSSIKVNGEETLAGERFSGDDRPKPQDDYGRTKYQAEQLVEAAADRTGLETVVLRPPLVYGPDVGGNFARLVAAVRRGLPLPFGSIDNRRSLISVRNLAEAALAAVTVDGATGSVLTLCDGDDVSTRTLVHTIGLAVGRRARLVPVSPIVLRCAGYLSGRGEQVRRLVGNLQVDSEEACRVLDWMPSEQLEQALARMFGQVVGERHRSAE